MNSSPWFVGRILGPLAGMILLGFSCALAQDRDVVAIITELKFGHGLVEVRPAGSVEWRQAQPLLALRPGDAIRATQDATAVVVLSGGRASIRVGAAESPFEVPAVAVDRSKTGRAILLLQASLNFLSASAKDALRTVLVTRGGPPPFPVIVTPRNTQVLAGSLTVEWQDSGANGYTVRILNSSDVVLEQMGVATSRLVYPPTAPRLVPGLRYTVQVHADRQPLQEAWFEVLDADRAAAIQQDLIQLEESLPAGTSPSSMAALRAGYLLGQRLPHEARMALVSALRNDPAEPTLYFLLGEVYASAGLPELAAESNAKARALLTP